ncbi:hypothetical protein K438DRAFT_1769583 [Mycena galopus ATCC 62051]|nr:hypothetical protein K438DRAFT_1769583 [Mycena galopus ATCC 62051]
MQRKRSNQSGKLRQREEKATARVVEWVNESLPAIILTRERYHHIPPSYNCMRDRDNFRRPRGCEEVESVHHIFVHCVHFEEWRREAREEVSLRTERKLVEAGIFGEEDQMKRRKLASSVGRLAYKRNSLGRKDIRSIQRTMAERASS